MLQLNDNHQKAKFYLPSTKEAEAVDDAGNVTTVPVPEDQQGWVVMEVGPMISGDMVGFDPETTSDSIAITFALLANRIKEWNYGYTDPEGKEHMLPITIENVKKLDYRDYTYLMQEVTGDTPETSGKLTEAQKKTLSNVSSPVVTGVSPT
jgi:hypothetical protein